MATIKRGVMAADHYTTVSNGLARNPNLSLKAKGLFLLVASHREGFRISVERLAHQTKDGEAAIKAAARELEEYGYLFRERTRTAGGRLGPVEYVITDSPEPPPSPSVDFPPVENPPEGNPLAVNHPPKKNSSKKTTQEKPSNSGDASGDAAETRDQQAVRIARRFYEDYPKCLTPFHGVRQAVKRALGAYTEDEVIRALVALGQGGHAVSGNTLTTQINGFPRRAPQREPSAYESSPASRGLDEVLW